ncbi:MAG: choice-of-anchor L domain-containing protein [Flavobacteriales bacterium]|nr:choice-of-anchor L domain-containing protein [Flavobacteriales bacterium]
MSRVTRNSSVRRGHRAGLIAGLLLIGATASAQLTVSQQTNLQQLAEAISGAGVQISNPTITCHTEGYGEFSYSGSLLGLESGVILTSGRITDAIGPNDAENTTFQQGTSGSTLLNTVTGRSTRDACQFEFDIIPGGDSLSFEFVFGSEEYNEWVGSQYNDVFGFFISGPGIAGDPGIGNDHNIALIPGTSTAVAINNVNEGLNSQYYQYNAGGQQLQMDGYTQGLMARSPVQPCQTYHLKLVVADASDRKFDSWVFVERIQSPNLVMTRHTLNGTANMVEGCNPGWVRFTRSPVLSTPLTLSYFIQGTATNGTDYPAIGDPNPAVAKTITIPGGQAYADQPVNPVDDGLNEGAEELLFLLGNPFCPGAEVDSLIFTITDTLIATVGPQSSAICPGGQVEFSTVGGTSYAWSPSTGLSCSSCPSPIASPSSTTNYTLVINEGACTRTVHRQVRVSNITISGTVTQPLCNGSSNGAINITAGGGIAPYTYAWTGPGGFTSSQEDLVGIAAGSYAVTVTDNIGCSRTQGFNVGTPAALALTLAPSILPFGQNVACHGASTGSLGLTVNGGAGPYATAWTGPNGFSSTQEDLVNIGAGSYTVLVTDANGCTASASFTMTESAALVASTGGVQAATCFGSSNGAALASATGGMPPYAYSWNSTPAQSGAQAINLAAGTYTVTVTDAYGCTGTAIAAVGQPAAAVSVSLSGIVPIIQCQGQSAQNGSATATASGGTGPYSYAWNTSPAQNSASASFDAGGSFSVTATDAQGCTASASITVTQPTPISTSIIAQSNVSCFGGSNGSASVNITGGSAIQSVTWNTSPPQTGYTATNLPAGTWIASAQHASGCVTQVPVTITQPAAPLAGSIAGQVNVSCFGASTGNASVSVSGGTAPYSYTWNTVPVQNTATANNLAAGTRTCTITDANGCTATQSVVISQPAAALSISISAQTAVACHGSATGSATISVSGGTAPYSYAWNTTPVQNGPTASNMPAGNWTCTVTDANGCIATRTVTITQPAAALGSSVSAQTMVACFGGANGSATVSANGGTAPYSYAWNTVPAQNSASANNLTAGNYTCTITDANGCLTTRNVTITQPAAAVTSTLTAQSNVLCFGGTTGSATVSAAGGTAPYGFSWNTTPPQSSATASALPAGTWTCTITDANGCATTRNVVIAQPASALGGSISAQTNVSCFGGANGSATVSAAGGTTPYSYAWNTSPVQTGATATGLTAGSYACTITDANGCATSSSVSIGQPAAALNASIASQVNVSCFGLATGSAAINVSGGTAPYTYNWNTTPVQTAAAAANLTAGTWTCTVTDANGCTVARNVTITQPAAALSATVASQVNVSCFGASTGSATVNASGGTTPYSYAWNTSPAQSTAHAVNLPADTWVCTVTDANGCVRTASVAITQPAMGLAASIAAQNDVLCHGGNTGSATTSATGGTAPYSYAWNTTPVQTTAAASALTAGSWTCTLTDANGCVASISATIAQPIAALSIAGTATPASCGGANDGAVDVTVTGGTLPHLLSWTGPNGFTSNQEDITDLASGVYTLQVTDAHGCSATRTFNVNQPGLFSIAGTVSDYNGYAISCAGSANGSIDQVVSGGTTPYVHAWSGPNGFNSSQEDLNGLSAGTYTYTLTDGNGCSTSATYALNEPAPIAIALVPATVAGGYHVTCFGATNGAIDASISGGLAGYNLAWTGPGGFNASSEDISGLGAGTYTLNLSDANGCPASAAVTLTQPALLAGSTTVLTDVGCFGSNDGSASAQASGGTAPYTYSWSPSPAQSGPLASALTAGSWDCTITDANGCTALASAVIAQPAEALAVSITSVSDVLCYEAASGTASALAQGGTAPYSYSWNSAPAQNVADAVNLIAGTYTVSVMDANGCTATADATVNQPSAGIQATFEDISHVSCFGQNDGAATVAVTGGGGSYTITWLTTPPQTGLTATGLSPGDHWVQIADNNGCDTPKLHHFSIIGPDSPLVVQLVISPISCAGAADASVDLTMSGGFPSYTHHWTDTQGNLTGIEDPTGLDPDTYHLHAFDGLGCAYDTSFTLTDPAAMTVSASVTPAECQGSPNGAIDISAAGGTGSLGFSWSGPDGFAAATEDISGVGAGAYHLTMTDANGCTLESDHTVTQPGSLQVVATLSAYLGSGVSCAGAMDGSIDAEVTGGTAPYSFAWVGQSGFGSTDEDLIGLGAGTYTLTVADANGCSWTEAFELTAPQPLETVLSVSDHNGFGVSCNGAADGSITSANSGGTAPFAYLWSGPDGFSATDADIADLAPGDYTLTVTDANGCTMSATTSIVEPEVISTNVNPYLYAGGSTISCAAANDGEIDLGISGGVAPYTVAWTNGLGYSSNAEDISALQPGAYQASITDANGCAAQAFIVLNAPAPLSLVATISDINGSAVTCAGATDGSISLDVSGGTGTYTYLWSNGSTDEDLVGIGAGSYTVTVTDANGCEAEASYTLNAPSTFQVELLASQATGGTSITCAGANDGSIASTISGGTAPYTLAWNGPSGFTSTDADLSMLAAGAYTLSMIDANGCTSAQSITLTEPAPVAVNIGSTTYSGGYSIPCAGLSVANATASAIGGTPAYTYVWSGPDGFTSTDAGIISLASGSYTVQATDANGCTGSASIILEEPAPLDVQLDILDQGGFPVSCNGNDGIVSLSIAGGTPQYHIGWTGPDGFTSTALTLSDLAAGDYELTVIDANGCMVTESFSLAAPEPIAAAFTFTSNTCPTDAAASIDLTVTGGGAPYSFAWSGPNAFSSADEDPSGLVTGTYMVSITDGLGCTGTFSAALPGPAPITSGTYVSFYGLYNLQCVGDSSGAIELTPSGGSTPFTVAIDGPGGFSSTALSNQHLVAGDYAITITDVNGCAMDTLVTLAEPDTQVDAVLSVSVYPSGTNVSCYGASDGWIDATVSGGSGPYTFDWRGPDSLAFNSEDISGLPAGDYNYELVVIDANQCVYSTTVTLTQPDSALHASVSLTDHNGFGVSCPTAMDGAIDLSYGGGNGGYGISWAGPDGFTSSDANLQGLGAGTYVLTLVDMNGCELTEAHIVSAPDPIAIALDAHTFAGGMNISCAGLADGSINSSVTGGAGGYTTQWSGPNGFTSTDITINALTAGEYCLQVTDANACAAQQCITLIEPQALTTTAAPVDAACGLNNGSIDLSVAGGTAPYAFLWNTGSAAEDLSGIGAGAYEVAVTDANGCSASTSATIATSPAVSGEGLVTPVLCHGNASGAIDLNMLSGTAPYAFVWSNGISDEDLYALSGGSYAVQVTDANGCTWEETWTVPESPAISISTQTSAYPNGYEVSSHNASDGSIGVEVIGGTAPYAFAWSTGAGSDALSQLPAGTYTLTVTDANGCTAEQTVVLRDPDDLVMPTGFTPNGDGYNELFFIQGLDAYASNILTVVNRWGNVVYDQLNYKNDWAGDNSSGEPLPNGTYFVILNINKGERILQGYVDLRR